ncbi:MAG: ABC transporter permease [Acidobacteriales bacterium]|nr:ABC transporter permease [Terriglobales bacterium]
MKAPDLLNLAVRNLRESVLRNSLTTLGITVGVASLVAMVSLGVGLQQMANQRLAKSGLFDTVVVTSRRDLRGFNREDRATAAGAAQSRQLDERARQEFETLPDVVEATPDIRFITELSYEGKPRLGMVSGLPYSARNNDAFDNMQGQFFSSEMADELVLQKEFAEELITRRQQSEDKREVSAEQLQSLLGKQVTLRYAERSSSEATTPEPAANADNKSEAGESESGMVSSFSVVRRSRQMRIVGITDQDPEGMRGSARGRVFMPLKLLQSLRVMLPSEIRESSRSFTSQQTYFMVNVRVKNSSQVQGVQEQIKKMGFNTFSILDATRSLRRFFVVLDAFLGIFGSLALAVASLGIVNTLVMAILERRREIGIMKAIGASDADVKKLFFVEAGVMGFFGGVAGVLLGWTMGTLINWGTNIYLVRQELPPETISALPWGLVAFAIGFAVGVSLLSGYYPARRAARLDPVQALRYE